VTRIRRLGDGHREIVFSSDVSDADEREDYEGDPRPITPPTELVVERSVDRDASGVWEKYTGIPWDAWEGWGCAARWPNIEFTWKEVELRRSRKIRRLDARTQKEKFRWEGRPGFAALWPSPTDGVHEEITLCEGERDCGVMRMFGTDRLRDAYTLGSCTTLPDIVTVRMLQQMGVKRVNVLFDSDEPGKKFDRRVSSILADAGFSVRLLDLGSVCRQYEKDVSDIYRYRNGVEFREALEEMLARAESVDDISMDAVLDNVEPGSWLWDGLVPQAAVTLISAPPKAYKTYLMYFVMRAMSQGIEFLGRHVCQGRVLYYSEMPRWIDKGRRDKVLKDCDRGHIFIRNYSDVAMSGKDWPERVNVLESDCERHGIDMLIVDTASSWFEFTGDDENKSAAIRVAFAPLVRLADQQGVAVCVLHHVGHGSGRPRGSTAFEGIPDVLLTMERSETTGTNTLLVRGRLAESVGKITWSWPDDAPEPIVHSDEVLPDDTDEDGKPLVDRVLEAVPYAPHSATRQQIEKEVGGSSAQRALKRLVEDGVIEEDVESRPYRYSRAMLVQIQRVGREPGTHKNPD
jgi:5S rRNA maturation endonuclease (ribonuclease M5)